MKLKENREIWINRVKDYRASSLTQKAWCEKNGVKVSALRYWLRTLREEAKVAADNSPSSDYEFAVVSIAQDTSPAVILEIQDVKLSITNDYDEILLLKLIKTLKKL
jgi:transposase-like protein